MSHLVLRAPKLHFGGLHITFNSSHILLLFKKQFYLYCQDCIHISIVDYQAQTNEPGCGHVIA